LAFAALGQGIFCFEETSLSVLEIG